MLKIIKIEDIIPNEYNFKRKTKKQLEELKSSLKEGVWGHNVIVDKNNKIITGQNIYKMCIELGYTELECEVVDTDKPEELNIIDNASAERADWDKRLLGAEINKIGKGEFSAYDMSFVEPAKKSVSIKKEKKLREITCPTCNLTFKLKK